jgi:putative transposase
MKGLLVRIARALNRLWMRCGSVFADRFHSRTLQTPREVRNALAYVLQNAHKHGCLRNGIDPYSSGNVFDGWKRELPSRGGTNGPLPTLKPRTWLLACGWKRHGLIDPGECPGNRSASRRGTTNASTVLDMSALRRAARRPTWPGSKPGYVRS